MASVKVALRVRPINKRERDLSCKCIINVQGKKTSIKNPALETDVKDFTYDHSYWSVDSNDKHFTTQEQVFNDLGMDVIDSAFQGYNACIFAYGQTGSGKSYTMMGCQSAIGLIPRICEAMYSRMGTEQSENNNKVEFKTEVSYLEIYNERVRDLLRITPKKGDAYNLKVREHPKEGPYVQDLSKHIVSKYTDIEKLMDIGNEHSYKSRGKATIFRPLDEMKAEAVFRAYGQREQAEEIGSGKSYAFTIKKQTTASTNMNDTSSRSHAIFTLNFTQAKFYTDMPSETVSKIHLVDLAGSERANSTGASGQRLKEGANINKSLVTLGSVISALAEASTTEASNAKKKVFIPYRDSVLTWLLKDSLGGNSKTIMIAAISPADVNYAETISTLRYANRAKNIINKPTINEDANVKLIRELRDEIESLRVMLTSVKPDKATSQSIADQKNMAEKLHKNEAHVEQLYKQWNNKWKETHKIMEEKALAFRREGFGIKMESDIPHLVCIDDDILSTGVTLYHLNEGRTHVGKDDATVKQDIVLRGPGIESEHCILESIEGNVTLHPIADENSVNGNKIRKSVRLSQGCVILLGKTNMFRFNHPGEAAKLRQKYASADNLASVVPTNIELEKPSYLFYNAGMEMERRYHEEAKDLERKRKEIEQKSELDAKKIEESRLELQSLQNERKVAEAEQRKVLEETQQRLENQRKNLELLRHEQDQAKENAQKELHELKVRIQQEQLSEKQKLDDEMRRLMQLNEMQQKSVKDQEDMLAKQKDEMEKILIAERQRIENQRQEVLRLQDEYQKSREVVAKTVDGTRQEGDGAEATPPRKSLRAEELRAKLEQLESELAESTKTSQREILQAKDNLKKAEMETLQGKVGLMQGKSELQRQWKLLDALQSKHKKTQEEIQTKIRQVREELEKAEEAEEEELMSQEKSILQRRQARKKVEEATQKLFEMESKLTRSDSITQNQDLRDWQNKEEVREMQEERTILMELLSKHQVALVKASQLVTESKTKLESHLENESSILGPVREHISAYEHELEPLVKLEHQIEKKCTEIEKEAKEKKKILYKQRKRINLLEKQHAQSSGNEGREGLSAEEIEELDHEREADLDLIHREKSVLRDMEEKFRKEQAQNELIIGEQYQGLEMNKERIKTSLTVEREKLAKLIAVHEETREYIEAELNGRREILKLSKEKVMKDKRALAKLDMKQQKTATKAAEELFMMAEVLEKELAESGKKEELTKIKDHRKKLQELDRQLRLAERRERFTGDVGPDGAQQCSIL